MKYNLLISNYNGLKKFALITLGVYLPLTLAYAYLVAPLKMPYDWPFFLLILTLIIVFATIPRKYILRREMELIDDGLIIEGIGTIPFRKFQDIEVNPSKPYITLTFVDQKKIHISPRNGYSDLAGRDFFLFLEELEKYYKSS